MRRRGFLGGLLLLAAPAIIRTPGLLMPVKAPPLIIASSLPMEGPEDALAYWMRLAPKLFAADEAFWDDRLPQAATTQRFDVNFGDLGVDLTPTADRKSLGFDPNPHGVGPDYVPTWRIADKVYNT